jgi:hypothetical protein
MEIHEISFDDSRFVTSGQIDTQTDVAKIMGTVFPLVCSTHQEPSSVYCRAKTLLLIQLYASL